MGNREKVLAVAGLALAVGIYTNPRGTGELVGDVVKGVFSAADGFLDSVSEISGSGQFGTTSSDSPLALRAREAVAPIINSVPHAELQTRVALPAPTAPKAPGSGVRA